MSFLKVDSYKICFEVSFDLKQLELCLVKHSLSRFFREANLNDQSIYPVQIPRFICRRRKKIRRVYCTGSLQQFLPGLSFEQSFRHLYNLINLELCLVRYEPISMTNTFILCSSPGLFAVGVKKKGGCTAPGYCNSFCKVSFFSNHSVIYII